MFVILLTMLFLFLAFEYFDSDRALNIFVALFLGLGIGIVICALIDTSNHQKIVSFQSRELVEYRSEYYYRNDNSLEKLDGPVELSNRTGIEKSVSQTANPKFLTWPFIVVNKYEKKLINMDEVIHLECIN